MAQSFNGTIKTNGEWVLVETLTDLTFTAGNIYNMWIGNQAYLKTGDYVTPCFNENFDYKGGTDNLYIKTNYDLECQLSILENEASS